MPATQQDIANKIGVSRRLVSYALNGESGVGAAMQHRILEVAQEMGYQTNRAARALVTKRTHQIALCVPTLNTPFHAEFVRHFEAHARHTNYDLLITTTLERKSSLAQLAVDGILLYPLIPHLAQQISCPTVILRSPPFMEVETDKNVFDQVTLGLSEASHAVMGHLLKQRPKRIAFVSFAGMATPAEPRYAGYLKAMQQAKLEVEVILLDYSYSFAENSRSLTHRALGEYFDAHGFPDALFCVNDGIAIGAYRALRAHGRSIPAQTLVVGCDDIPEVEDVFPSLTSIRYSWKEICRSAWEMLMSRIENPDLPARQATFQSELVIRDSSVVKI